MAHTDKGKTAKPDIMMLHSGSTSHITAQSSRVANKKYCSATIRLADKSTTTDQQIGVRTVNWLGESGSIGVSLPETPVGRDFNTIILSVQSFVRMDIAALFMPGKVVLFDILKDNKIIGHASQGSDGQFYTSDNERSISMDDNDDD